ncbi:MAG: hypothetical protein RMJ87_10740 [Cytophagales bacterium]|nr:hypothetical protein [Bernardetiaceae bacterium]MDW8205496.1 hypothetical protein [Cytophagales bacterium]
MYFQDLLIAPIYALVILAVMYQLRNRLSPPHLRKFFIPALLLKFVGAIALGLIYFFYYGGGDTDLYYALGTYISRSFYENPSAFFKLVFGPLQYDPETYPYLSVNMFYYRKDTDTYFLLRLVGVANLLTGNVYSATALLFATFSFLGSWAFYLAMVHMYPAYYRSLALAVLFIPSVIFWGSGIMKDSITFGGMGLVVHGFYFGIIRREKLLKNLLVGGLGFFLVIAIKIYIIYCLLPALMLWLFLRFRDNMRSGLAKALSVPFLALAGATLSVLAVFKLTSDTAYSFENLAHKAEVTATYLHQQAEGQGSAYEIPEFDGSLTSLLTYAPRGITVTLFRPFLWEAKSPVQLLAALEALVFIFLTVRVLYKVGISKTIATIFSEHFVFAALVFAIGFSFAVGVTSGNFGTLVRYKIPMMPFYVSAMFIILEKNKRRKLVRRSAFAPTPTYEAVKTS